MVLARVCDYPASVFYYILILPFLGFSNAALGYDVSSFLQLTPLNSVRYIVNENALINYSLYVLISVQIHSACSITLSLAEWVNASLLFVPVKPASSASLANSPKNK
jgi:hypothetical protein